MKTKTLIAAFAIVTLVLLSGSASAELQVQSGDTFTIQWSASLESDVAFYTLYTQGLRKLATITPDGTVTRLAPLFEGENILTLTATDKVGNESDHSEPSPNVVVKVLDIVIGWVVE
jgi:hypothetical protein